MKIGHGAACAGMDPEKFFPFPPQTAEIEEAKAVCRQCPVKAACLAWALDNEDFGVWGGTSEDERRAMRRARTGRKAA